MAGPHSPINSLEGGKKKKEERNAAHKREEGNEGGYHKNRCIYIAASDFPSFPGRAMTGLLAPSSTFISYHHLSVVVCCVCHTSSFHPILGAALSAHLHLVVVAGGYSTGQFHRDRLMKIKLV